MPEPDPKDPQLPSTPQQPPSPAVPPFTIGFNLNPEVRGVGLMIPRGVDPATIRPPDPTPSELPPP